MGIFIALVITFGAGWFMHKQFGAKVESYFGFVKFIVGGK